MWVMEYTGAVVPKARPRVTSHGTYMPKAYSECLGAIRESAQAQGAKMAMGPVALTVYVRRPAPKRLKVVEPDTCRPDLDNLVGTFMDALTGLAWGDDSQVVRIVADKLPRLPNRGWWSKVVVSSAVM